MSKDDGWHVPAADRIESPNYSKRKHGIRMIVLHTTICPRQTRDNYDRVRRWLANKTASGSTHFVVLRSGRVVQGVPCTKAAWHAGQSEWVLSDGTHVTSCNHWSIGIDLDSVGPVTRKGDKLVDCYGSPFDGPTLQRGKRLYEAYTVEQISSLARLVRELVSAYDIPEADVVGHCDVSPGRKVDPENFPWWILREAIKADLYTQELHELASYYRGDET